jgi:seryl-tRNA synthetase
MIDIQLLRENPELVKQKSAEKKVKVDIDNILALDNEYRDLLGQVESLRQKRNEISAQMKDGKPNQDLIDQGKQLKIELAEREEYLGKTKMELDAMFSRVPNLHFDDVPVGDEADSVEISRFGDCETVGAIDHLDFATARGWVDFEGGAKVAGAKFYFLRGDLALLENAVVQYALSVVRGEGFEYITVPHMVNARTATGTGFAPRSDEQSDEYFIEDEDLSLIATAEMPLTGLHADEIIDESKLPILYAGYSPCYRKEAGTYGKHTRGLFRVHQFNKLEMYAFTLPEASLDMHQKILGVEEKIWQEIGIPYHIINIASGDLGAPAAKKYDVEYWSKVDGAFRELTSCSNCTDFQTRNLNIRVRREDGRVELVHSLNGTAVSMARTLVAILEHFQNGDGTLRIPEVLQQFMGGRQTI